MKNEKQTVGKKGEDQACLYLAEHGHTIIERNWRSAHLELDIVSLKGNELHVVEVKSRTVPCQAPPQASVTKRKQERLVRAANAYLHSKDRKSLPPDLNILFDVISVIFDRGSVRTEYFPEAYRPMYY